MLIMVWTGQFRGHAKSCTKHGPLTSIWRRESTVISSWHYGRVPGAPANRPAPPYSQGWGEKMRKLLLAVACMALWTTVASAQSIYIAQNTTGADSGSDCKDAHSAGWFNSAANWGGGTAQISPGTVVHLCGTFTGTAGSSTLTTQGNGITIHFETGALLQSPASGINGAIYVQNNSVTLDGGPNGTIEHTTKGM